MSDFTYAVTVVGVVAIVAIVFGRSMSARLPGGGGMNVEASPNGAPPPKPSGKRRPAPS